MIYIVEKKYIYRSYMRT